MHVLLTMMLLHGLLPLQGEDAPAAPEVPLAPVPAEAAPTPPVTPAPDDARTPGRSVATMAAVAAYALLLPALACGVGAPCWLTSGGSVVALSAAGGVASLVAWLVARKVDGAGPPLWRMLLAGVVPLWPGLVLGTLLAAPPLLVASTEYVEVRGSNVHISNDTMQAGARSPAAYGLLASSLTIFVVCLAAAGTVAAAAVGITVALQGGGKPSA